MDDIGLFLNNSAQIEEEETGDDIGAFLSGDYDAQRYQELEADDVDYFLGNPVTDFAAGAVETGINLGASIPMGIIGGVHSVGQYLGGASAEEARETLGGWMEKAYQPRSEAGKAAVGTMGEYFEKAGDVVEDIAGPDVRFLAEAGLSISPVTGLKFLRTAHGVKTMRQIAKEAGKNTEEVVKDVATGDKKQRSFKFGGRMWDAIQDAPNILRGVGLDRMAAGMERMAAREKLWVGENYNKYLERMDELMKEAPDTFKEEFKSATLMNKDRVAKRLWKEQFPDDVGVIDGWYEARRSWARKLEKLNENFEKVAGYWPRLIRDWDGLIAEMKRDPRYKGKAALIEAVQKQLAEGAIDDIQAGKEIRNALVAGGEAKVSPMKSSAWYERQFKKVPPKYHKYFADPNEAIGKYVHDTARAVAEHEFLGKKPSRGGMSLADIIQEKINQGVEAGWTAEQVNAVGRVLPSVFGEAARRSPNKFVQNTKTLSYLMTIADPYSALTQLSDIAGNLGEYGMRDTIMGIVKPKMSAKKAGVRDIQHEMAEHSKGLTGGFRKVLDKALEYTGFKAVDFFGKNSRMNAAFQHLTRKAAKNPEKLYLEYKRAGFIDKIAKQYVEAWKKADPTDPILVEAALMELMRRQPLSVVNQSVMYNNHPNGRLMFTLRTWSIRQLNGVIRDIQVGRKGRAAKYILAMGLGMVAIDLGKMVLKKSMSGERIRDEDISDKAMMAILKAVSPLASKYEAETLWRQGPGVALGKSLAPPAWEMMWSTIRALADGDFAKAVRPVPFGDVVEPIIRGAR